MFINPDGTGLKITKLGCRFVVGSGVSKITSDIIVNNTRTPSGKWETLTIVAGSGVVGLMASDASRKYTEEYIDKIVAEWNDLVSTFRHKENPYPTAS